MSVGLTFGDRLERHLSSVLLSVCKEWQALVDIGLLVDPQVAQDGKSICHYRNSL